ncbi:MAG: Rieske 2Fe-2S domain-containing protein [Chloroflexota bacterium]
MPYHDLEHMSTVLQAAIAHDEFVHTGPGTLGGRFLRMFWQPVYLLADLKLGRAVPLRIMGEDYTLYRGDAGAPHVVAFRCAHRGTQLSTGWVEGDEIRCFYHGWKYDQTGQCVEQPAEDAGFAAKIRIQAFPTVEYLGLVFAYLGEGEAPPFPRYPQLEGEGVLETHSYVRDCSYFNSIENNMDEAHIAFVHRASSFTESGLNRFLPEISGEETDYGIIRYGSRPNGATRVAHLVMPNLIVFQGVPAPEKGELQGSDSFAWRVPVEDTFHRSFNLTLAHVTGEAAERYRERREQQKVAGPSVNELAASALRGDVHVDTFGGRPDAVNIQDVVAQVGQGRIPEREHDRLGRSDILVILLRKIFLRELQALAEGRPTKRWIQPERLAAAFGI